MPVVMYKLETEHGLVPIALPAGDWTFVTTGGGAVIAVAEGQPYYRINLSEAEPRPRRALLKPTPERTRILLSSPS